MVPDPKSGKSDRSAIKFPVALLLCGLLGFIPSAADPIPKASAPVEAPLTATSGYGVGGLVLWLAADSGITFDKDNASGVSVLKDKTGNFILTPDSEDQEPTYVANVLNGHPVLRFDGDQALYSPDDFGTAINRDMTIIVVAMTTNTSLRRQQFLLYLGQNQTVGANRAFEYLKGKEGLDGQFVICYGQKGVANSFFMTGESINSALSQATFYRNGRQTIVSGLAENNGINKYQDLSVGVTMGAATDPVCGWQGDIAEELVFNHQLTPAEMQTVWSCLSSKYGLQ